MKRKARYFMVVQKLVSRKQELVLKELDSAWSFYQHLEDQIFNWRSLTITLLLGYTGFLFTQKVNNNAMILPLLLIPAPFLLLEIYRRAHLVFLGENIQVIQKIFALKNNREFLKEIYEYEFRDQRLKRATVLTLRGLLVWLRYMLLGFIDVDAIIWYLFIITSAIIAYLHFHV